MSAHMPIWQAAVRPFLRPHATAGTVAARLGLTTDVLDCDMRHAACCCSIQHASCKYAASSIHHAPCTMHHIDAPCTMHHAPCTMPIQHATCHMQHMICNMPPCHHATMPPCHHCSMLPLQDTMHQLTAWQHTCPCNIHATYMQLAYSM